MRTNKLAGILLSIVLALALLLTAGLLLFLNSPFAKSALADAVQAGTERTLGIDGSVGLSLWPDIGITAQAVRLSEYRKASEFAFAGKLRCSVALQPLLSGRLVINGIDVSDARVIIVKRRDGTLNIDDLLASDDGAPSRELDLSALRVERLRVVWRDEEGGTNTVINDVGLTVGRAIRQDTGLAIADFGLSANWRHEDTDLSFHLAAPQIALNADAERTLSMAPFTGSVSVAGEGYLRPLVLEVDGSLTGKLALPSLAMTLAGRIDDTHLTAKLDATRFSPPDVTFDVQVDRFDADRYFSTAKGKASASGGPDLSALKDSRWHGQIRIGELRVAKVVSRNLVLTAGD